MDNLKAIPSFRDRQILVDTKMIHDLTGNSKANHTLGVKTVTTLRKRLNLIAVLKNPETDTALRFPDVSAAVSGGPNYDEEESAAADLEIAVVELGVVPVEGVLRLRILRSQRGSFPYL
nr:hypothetical protein Iba_chr05bCG10350 [Ipomoea batatas]